MRSVCFFFLFLNTEYWTLNTAQADSWQDLHQGDQSAQAFLNEFNQKKSEGGDHPFYQGISPESNYNEADLVGLSQAAAAADTATQMIISSSDSRPQIKIDPGTDSLLTGANKITTNPLKVIGGTSAQVVEIQQGGKTEIIVCEESGEDSLENCTSECVVKIRKFKVQKEWVGAIMYSKCAGYGHHLPCSSLRSAVDHAVNTLYFANLRRRRWPYTPPSLDRNALLNITGAYKACMTELKGYNPQGCGCHAQLPALGITGDQIQEVSLLTHPNNPWAIYPQHDYFHEHKNGQIEYNIQPIVKITYQIDSHEVLPDEWVDNCSRLEERTDQGLCGYISRVCTQGPQTRIIDGIPITRDCWQETLTYVCSYPARDDCGPLKARGCGQITSACKEWVGETCVVYQQTYQCKKSSRTAFQIQGGDTPFCMDGNCRDQSWEPNNELMSSLAQLSILKEMQGQLEGGILFKGTDNRCSRCVLSFKDCCGSGKGWGNDLGLAHCNADEKLLNKRRIAGLCHLVGTYCAKKVLGKCVKKKTSYCCFGSKLLKAFHEQGRAQIGMGWGEPKAPLCRGFTIEEIQKIDFSQLDLSEFFEDLMKNYNPGKMGNINQQVSDRLEAIKGGMVPNTKQQPPQRQGGA